MVTHSYYEEDPRVRREAESLVGAGREVDVFALRQPGDDREAEFDGVRVRRLDVQRHQGASLRVYLAEYVAFLVRAAFALVRAHARRRYALVQVHSLPDFLAFAALPLRIAGVPVLLDLHEAMPEFFRSRFPGATNPVIQRLLLLQERVSIGVASHAITVNDALVQRLVDLGVPADKVSVVINSPSLRRFDPTRHAVRRFADDGTVRLIYAGALTPTYEVDVALAAVARLCDLRPELHVVLDIYGRGDSEAALHATATALGVGGRVVFHGRVPIDDVPAAIARADIGLAPTRRDEFTDVSISTKIFEYGAMNKPVIASALPLVEQTFERRMVRTYAAGDPDALARAVLAVVEDVDGREAAVARTRERVAALAWDRESERYLALVEGLARR